MAEGGDQRERAREKNLKKQKTQKSKADGPLEKRKERDADVMREKQRKAEERKAAEAAAAGKK